MNYRRLPGKKRGFGNWRTLWVGDDHLLSVASNGYTEEYTRYYFKDIKAILSRRTVRGKIWNALLAAAFAVCLLAFMRSLGNEATSWTVATAVLSSLMLAALITNILLGATCRCHILMPLGIHELPTLRRIRSVRRTLDTIGTCIKGSQGALTPEEARAPAAYPHAQIPTPPLHGRLETARGKRQVQDYRGGMHLAAFFLLVGQAVLGFAALLFHGRPFLLVSGLVTLSLFACLVAAVVKQQGSPVPRFVGRLIWVALGVLAIAITSGYYVGIMLNVMHASGNAIPEMDMPGIFAAVTSQPFFPSVLVCYSVCIAAIGALGLFSYARWRRAHGAAAPDTTTPQGGAAP